MSSDKHDHPTDRGQVPDEHMMEIAGVMMLVIFGYVAYQAFGALEAVAAVGTVVTIVLVLWGVSGGLSRRTP